MHRHVAKVQTLGLLASGLLTAMTSLSQPAAAQLTGPLTIQSQGSFFIGGTDEQSDGLSPPPAAGSTSTIGATGTWTVDQMYVQYQIPNRAQHLPIVLIHGCCLTGKTWETTPDGRMGWNEYFLRQHFPTYVIDQVGRGRSGYDPTAINEVAAGTKPAGALPPVFTAGHESAWTVFRFGLAYPNAFPGLQFPTQTVQPNGQFWKQMVPDFNRALPVPNPTLADLSTLSINLAGAILVSHSESGIFPFQTAGISTQGIAGIISIEPGACTGLNAAAVARIPTMILYGDHVSEFPNWANSLQTCTAFAKEVTAAGGDITVLQLPSVGLYGNSHMLMQDRNNLQIGKLLVKWVATHVEKQ